MKKALYVLFVGVILVSGWGQTQQVKIAILKIENRLQGDVDTEALTESFQLHVINQRYFLVVERSQLNRILEEQKLSLSGLTTEEQATQIGNLLGAQKIWVGSLARFGEKYMITMKSVDTKTGVIDFADQVYAYDVEGLLDVIPDLADRMIRKAKGERVGDYKPKQKPPSQNLQASSGRRRETTTFSRPDESFEIGFYRVSMSTNADRGGALSFMLKSPADENFEFAMDLRLYGGEVAPQWNVRGLNFNINFMLNLIANGYVLLGGGIGFGFDIPTFAHSEKDYKINCFEWTVPLSLQFGVHLGRSFMVVAEVSSIFGFSLTILNAQYPTSEIGEYLTVDGENYYVPSQLTSYIKDGLTYGYAGIRLSFLY